MRIAIIVPTTAGPSLICKLRPLHTAPRSLVFTQSDYKPLEISARYNDFLQPGGPLAGALGMEDTRFELRLSARVESGRSWELPVALAHWALAQGHEIVGDTADMVIWATGALDSDLSIIAQDYHLDSKIAQSLASVTETLRPGGQALLLTPEPRTGEQFAEYPSTALPHTVSSLAEAIDHVADTAATQPTETPSVISAPAQGPSRRAVLWAGLGAAGLVLGVAILAWRAPISASEDTVLRSGEQDMAAQPDPPTPASAEDPPIDETAEPGNADAAMAPAGAAWPVLPKLVTLRAPDGASCIDVLFDRAVPIRHKADAALVFAPSVANNLCAIGLALPAAAEGPISVQLDGGLRAQILPSDRQADYNLAPGEEILLRLKEAQKAPIAYAWRLSGKGVEEVALSHRLVAEE